MTSAERLWIPGEPLPAPEATVSSALIRDAFAEHVAPATESVVSLNEESLSALIIPEHTPNGFLFVDIDDLLGDLSRSLRALQFASPRPAHERRDNHDYGEDLFFSDHEKATKQALIAMIKTSEAGMLPAEGIGEIKEYLQGLRAAGVYVTFVTAPTPASELPTIQNFLGRYLQGACDGLVITNGDYTTVDKGTAARSVVNFINKNTPEPIRPSTPVVAIDDWPSHLAKLRGALSEMPENPDVTTIQYVFPSSQHPDQGSVHLSSATECFAYAFQVFREHLADRRPYFTIPIENN